MLKLKRTNKFEKDIKLLIKRHQDFAKLKTLLELLVTQQPLPLTYRDHPLRGDYVGYRECSEVRTGVVKRRLSSYLYLREGRYLWLLTS
jgi:mRNA-degrading endonuclease YafQ of YafQ-DinJ toxin-antitoxin module